MRTQMGLECLLWKNLPLSIQNLSQKLATNQLYRGRVGVGSPDGVDRTKFNHQEVCQGRCLLIHWSKSPMHLFCLKEPLKILNLIAQGRIFAAVGLSLTYLCPVEFSLRLVRLNRSYCRTNHLQVCLLRHYFHALVTQLQYLLWI